MNMKKFWRYYALYVFLLLCIVTYFCCAIRLCQLCRPEPQPQIVGSVVDKYEANGKYFVEIQVEITADEYIGYDIGDGYSIKEKKHD